MPTKVKILFLTLLLALLAPYFVFAATYKIRICEWTKEEKAFAPDRCILDADTSKCPEITVGYDGLVPCGKQLARCLNGVVKDGQCETAESYITVHCTFCHIFQMIDSVLDYVLSKLVPAIVVLMVVIGGVMFFFGGAKPEMVQKGKTLIKGILIGIVLIYGSYIIVGEVLALFKFSRHNPFNEVFKKGVFSINCDIFIPAKEFVDINKETCK